MADDDEALFSDRFSTRIKNRFPQRMRFRQILMQNKVWAYWDQDARAFREIKIRKMRRKHARNAAAWLVKNQKDVTEIMLCEGG